MFSCFCLKKKDSERLNQVQIEKKAQPKVPQPQVKAAKIAFPQPIIPQPVVYKPQNQQSFTQYADLLRKSSIQETLQSHDTPYFIQSEKQLANE